MTEILVLLAVFVNYIIAIEKVAASHRGRKRSPETCAKISARALLRAPELRAAMITRNANRSAADIAKCVAAMRGSQTPESIEKTAAKNRGKPRSAETKAKQSAAALGRKQSPEHIKNRADARRAANALRRAEAANHQRFLRLNSWTHPIPLGFLSSRILKL